MRKILIIQTAFIGDVILATALVEELAEIFPESKIDFLLRKGNEKLLDNNPNINEVIIWHKANGKNKNLFRTLKTIRSNKYDLLINLQRFLSTGILAVFSKAKVKLGFKKNPLSFFYTKSYEHVIDPFIEIHEVERNLKLISGFTKKVIVKPKLYPSENDYDKIKSYTSDKYICLAPASVWFTKQFPKEKWVEFLNLIPKDFKMYLIGSQLDSILCKEIKEKLSNNNIISLAGKLSFLESAALMKGAVMNYVNDSAPLHMASSMNANVAAIFCSTVPGFGFGPLSDNSKIIEIKEKLDCRPCGLHGKSACPEQHFKCGYEIKVENMISNINNIID